MDCDGPKHALVRDVDGSLLGLYIESSIVPYAELRYSTKCFTYPYCIPYTTDLMKNSETRLTNADPFSTYYEH